MWTCSNCGAEMNDANDVCLNCWTLAPALADDLASIPHAEVVNEYASAEAIEAATLPDNLATIALFGSLEEASRILRGLEAQGITAFLAEERTGSSLLDPAANFQIQVLGVEEDRARAVLGNLLLQVDCLPCDPEVVEESAASLPFVEVLPEQAASLPEDDSLLAPARIEEKPAPAAIRLVPPPASLNPLEKVRFLESQLSTLMDQKDTPDWTINPAYHPDVIAFIRFHADNAVFWRTAQALQKNRASFYSSERARGKRP